MDIFVFVLVEVHNVLVTCLYCSLAVQMMSVEGCSEGHFSVERQVREIPRWTFTCTHKRLGSPVGCSLPYIACWLRWVGRLYEGGHTIPLVGELVCGNFLDGRSCHGTLAVGGRFGS